VHGKARENEDIAECFEHSRHMGANAVEKDSDLGVSGRINLFRGSERAGSGSIPKSPHRIIEKTVDELRCPSHGFSP